MSVVPSIQRLKIFKKKHNEFGDVVGDKGKSVGEGERKSKSKRKRERERERKRAEALLKRQIMIMMTPRMKIKFQLDSICLRTSPSSRCR